MMVGVLAIVHLAIIAVLLSRARESAFDLEKLSPVDVVTFVGAPWLGPIVCYRVWKKRGLI